MGKTVYFFSFYKVYQWQYNKATLPVPGALEIQLSQIDSYALFRILST